MFRVSPSLVLLGVERWGRGAKAGGEWVGRRRGDPGPPPLGEDRAPHCESAPAHGKAACSVFFPVHRKTFDPGFSDSFLSPRLPIHPQGAGPLAMPTPPHHPTRSTESNGEAADKGAFLQSGSPSSHKFSGRPRLAATTRSEAPAGSSDTK